MSVNNAPQDDKLRVLAVISWIAGILAVAGTIEMVVALGISGSPGPVVLGTLIFAAICARCRSWMRRIEARVDQAHFDSLGGPDPSETPNRRGSC